jgi:hypothetical protein
VKGKQQSCFLLCWKKTRGKRRRHNLGRGTQRLFWEEEAFMSSAQIYQSTLGSFDTYFCHIIN